MERGSEKQHLRVESSKEEMPSFLGQMRTSTHKDTEVKVTSKFSHEFNWTENWILGTYLKLDVFQLNSKVLVQSEKFIEPSIIQIVWIMNHTGIVPRMIVILKLSKVKILLLLLSFSFLTTLSMGLNSAYRVTAVSPSSQLHSVAIERSFV